MAVLFNDAQSPISIVAPIITQPSNPILVSCKVLGGICKLRLMVLVLA